MSNRREHTFDGQGRDLSTKDMSPRTRHRPHRSNSIPQDRSDKPAACSVQDALSSSPKPGASGPSRKRQESREACKASDNGHVKEKAPSTAQHLRKRTHLKPTATVNMGNPVLTDNELVHALGNWVARKATNGEDVKLAVCFISAGILPPVTKKSLSELDIHAIIMNAKLRHDVNFDRDLHFRPNFDGEKGKEKMKIAENYWTALRAELDLYTLLFHHGATPDGCEKEPRDRIVKASQRRIPVMFDTIREILKNLIPEKDQTRVDEQLDVAMLVQQIEKGVCDLVALARWLSQLLKAHCAPMRDQWVQKMVRQTELAVEVNRSDHMVDALRELLGILEAMKLDVANHQIRHLRALLIEDTINFEQKYHLSRIARDRINVDASRRWFSREQYRARQLDPASQQQELSEFQFETFLHSFLRLLLSNNQRDTFPETFYLDCDRLRGLKAELEDLVYFDICCVVFNDIVRRIGHGIQTPESTYQTLRQNLLTIVRHHGTVSSKQWVANLDNIVIELVRLALHECHLPNSYNLDLVQLVDESLRRVFLSPYPNIFALHAERVHRYIAPHLLNTAKRHLNLSPIDMFNSLVAHPVPPSPPPAAASDQMSAGTAKFPQLATMTGQVALSRNEYITEIVRRITHVAVLHWRIWSPIVYTRVDNRSPKSAPKGATGATKVVASTEVDATATSLSRQRSLTASNLPIRQQNKASMQSVDVETALSASKAKDGQRADLGG